MNYIVLDMEWNQPLSKSRLVKNPVVLRGEIIQIGAVKVNEKMEVIDTFDVTICPKYYTKMKKDISELTCISTEDITAGVPFAEACEKFKSWCGKDFVFITWGNCDERVLKSNLAVHGLDDTWISICYDAQIMFDDQITMEGRNYPLNYAIYRLGIKPRSAHNALNDAINTTEVIKQLDVKGWIAEEEAYWAEQANIA